MCMFPSGRHLTVAACVAALVAWAAPLHAQQVTDDLHAIAAAIASEQARIAELRAELDRRSTVLTDLTVRLERLMPGRDSVEAPSSPAPPKVSTEAQAASASPRFQFYGDAKVRYETLQQGFPGCVGCPDRQRGRLRLRLGAEGHLAPDFTAVMGLAVGEIDDPNTVYVNLGNNFSRKVATWDRGYVEYHPTAAPWMNLTAGKFPYTWLRSSMTFDVDFYPEGLSQRFSFDLAHARPLKNLGIQTFELIANEQPNDRHMTVLGTQVTAVMQPTTRISTRVATVVGIQHPEFLLQALVNGTDVGVRNTNATVTDDGVTSYRSQFRYVNLIVENGLRTAWDAWPVTVGMEYQRNLGAESSRDTGLSFRVDAGRSQRRGDWDVSWHLFRVEQDAILAGFGESDWRAPSNVLQHRFAVNRMIHPNVQLSYTWYRGRTLDVTVPGALILSNLPGPQRDPWMNRMYFDITYRY